MEQNLHVAIQAVEAGGGQDNLYQTLLRAAQMQNHANLRIVQMPLMPPIRPNFAPLPQGIVFPANVSELFTLTGAQVNAILAAYQLPIAGTVAQRRTRLFEFLVGSNAQQIEGQDAN